MCQIIPTGCQQHIAFVVSCSHIGSKGELSKELLNPKPVGVFSGNAVGFQGNESYPHCGQKAGIAGNSSKVPDSLQTTLHQLPTIGRPSHGSSISHPTGPLISLPVSTLVNSQTLVSNSQSTHTDSGLNHLCCIPEILEDGQVSLEGSSNWAARSTHRAGNTDASLSGWGGLWQQCGVRGSWKPQVRASHIHFLELWAVFLTVSHFRARTVRMTHSGKDGQYNSGIFNQPPGGHKFPTLSSVNEKAPVLGVQTLPFSQSKPHSQLLQRCGGLTFLFGTETRGMVPTQGGCSDNLEGLQDRGRRPFCQQVNDTYVLYGFHALAHEWPDLLLYAFTPIPLLWSVLTWAQEIHHPFSGSLLARNALVQPPIDADKEYGHEC